MRPHALATACFALGIALLSAGLMLVGMPSGASLAFAQDLPPRPTLEATTAPQPTQTSEPKKNEKHKSRTPVPTGRITGTIIDLVSGAPTSGIGVLVGNVLVYSDANGNYERVSLPAGTYTVTLMLPSAQSVAAQGVLAVQLPAGGNVIQHLAFYSAPTPVPAAPPAPPVPVATPAFVAGGVAPQTLPDTSGPQAIAHPYAPKSLPHTSGRRGGWSLALFGSVLVVTGIVLRGKRP